ncbi:MAG TPA: hypothetical protein VGJ81_08075 [Thermoanaerobaculia bacterium]
MPRPARPAATPAHFNCDTAASNARGGFFGSGQAKLLQTAATLDLDTTDQKSVDFIDSNRFALNVQTTGLSLGELWMHGNAGIEARVERGFHHADRNIDVVAKVSGWVPVIRSLTPFPKNSTFLATPLSFTASYGYRDKQQEGAEDNGRVLAATALYPLFLFDNYQIDLDAQWTHTDIDDLPTGTSKTQRRYKATVSYLANVDNGFKVTSIEDGSFGVMLKTSPILRRGRDLEIQFQRWHEVIRVIWRWRFRAAALPVRSDIGFGRDPRRSHSPNARSFESPIPRDSPNTNAAKSRLARTLDWRGRRGSNPRPPA